MASKMAKFDFAGKRFFEAIVEAEQQRDYIINTVLEAYKGNAVFVLR